MGIASRMLKENGMADAAREMRSRVMKSGDYDLNYERGVFVIQVK
jgi:hypothetical protein